MTLQNTPLCALEASKSLWLNDALIIGRQLSDIDKIAFCINTNSVFELKALSICLSPTLRILSFLGECVGVGQQTHGKLWRAVANKERGSTTALQTSRNNHFIFLHDAQFMNDALFQDLTQETLITSALLLCSLVQLILVGAAMAITCVTGSGIILSTNESTCYCSTDYKAHMRMELSKFTSKYRVFFSLVPPLKIRSTEKLI